MAVKSYLVTFRPIDVFFWGNEKTLNDDNLSYFVHSNRFPQQTTLLGGLRYKLLEAKNLLSTNNSKLTPEAFTWIGKSSFSVNNPLDDYGYIKQLSPVFLKENEKNWHFAPKDHQITLNMQKARVRYSNESSDTLAYFDKFDAKVGIPEQMILAGATEYREISDFFQEDVRTGIQKNDLNEDKAFFKQSYYRFKSNTLSFALIAHLDVIAGECLTNFLGKCPFIRLGAEQRSFEMNISEIDNIQEYYNFSLENLTNFSKIILLGDAYISSSFYQHCVAVISETVDFRNIETNHETEYWNWKKTKYQKGNFPSKLAVKCNLLERGSVFYVKAGKEHDVENEIKAAPHFQKIGYNTYLKFSPNSRNPEIHIS